MKLNGLEKGSSSDDEELIERKYDVERIEPKTSRRRLVPFVIVSTMLIVAPLILVFVLQYGVASVAIGVTGGCTQTATNTNTCTITMSGSITAGRTVLVGVGTPGARTVSSITGGGTYSKRSSIVNTVNAEMWSTTVGGATGGTSSVVVTMSGNGRFTAWASEYTGVTFFNQSGASVTQSGSTANPSISYNTGSTSNWFVAVEVGTGTAPTSGLGNLRDARAATGVDQGYVDNTGSATLTLSTTHAATAWAIAGLELHATSACSENPTSTFADDSGVTFEPTSPLNGAATPAKGQSAGLPAITVTNNGPSTCSIGISRTSSAPVGVEDQWNTVNTAPSPGTHDVTTSNVVVCASIVDGATCNIYMWSRVTASGSTAPNTYVNTYVIQEA